ncbi:16S rRNA (guanine(966)-N(2))-methyltransferase RsmD [Neopusillimonas maritima]|uniref:16S rRNA (Guanine(966)-N(2))-methyltransferase RsmD n=1 Tax=Neopusillimonas maritima TaxID=2026239 RepID=A0A3A1YTQ8_9BURK|nr:16S rRNA (guanine(966)-N(2))-methyltransferase RsmD [Neopusillimonas maritima]RIY39437.1 16S rRNA (guanine(966)-N(2))-methyltransferase RsmD [Neopusillimonas maritima]
MKKHNIRIVGGVYRRTPIPVINAPGLRPTPDRIRETLYNWIGYFWGNNFQDKNVLDLFAGTGALGFEAASRGAAHVQMVEANPQAVAALRALRTKLKAGNVRVFPGDALHVLDRTANPFDLILLDPPFGQNWLERIWTKLPVVLADNGLVYVEAESPIVPPPNFETLREGRAGQVHYALLTIAAPQDNKSQAELH